MYTYISELFNSVEIDASLEKVYVDTFKNRLQIVMRKFDKLNDDLLKLTEKHNNTKVSF